jgi:hypothetical protein
MPEAIEEPRDLGATPTGTPYTSMAMEIKNVGDGLSKAIDVEPIVVKDGERVYVAVEVVKTGETYRTVGEGEGMTATRVQVFKALKAAIVDGATVRRALEQNYAKVAAAEAMRKSGQLTLVVEGDDPKPGETTRSKAKRAEAGALADDVDEAIRGADAATSITKARAARSPGAPKPPPKAPGPHGRKRRPRGR